MSEEPLDHRSTALDIPSPDGVQIVQTSTRGEGVIEQGEAFSRDAIDFSGALDHLSIHTEGTVAGSQFNGELFASPQDVVDRVTSVLPEELHYDQHGRAELTITTEGTVLGYSGVKPLHELEQLDGVNVVQGVRTPGGEPAEVDSIKGAWFPEMVRSPETGRFEVATNPDGSVKNPHGKFEPEALIAHVEEGALPQALATDKLTAIVQKNPETGVPTVLTVFPGENAPAFPAKIESEAFQVDTLQGGPEAAYWGNHAFIMPIS
jgi:hypothetical protein